MAFSVIWLTTKWPELPKTIRFCRKCDCDTLHFTLYNEATLPVWHCKACEMKAVGVEYALELVEVK